jgi:hypothetical protein
MLGMDAYKLHDRARACRTTTLQRIARQMSARVGGCVLTTPSELLTSLVF